MRNEIFRQMSLTLTLLLDVPVSPMDAIGLNSFKNTFYSSILIIISAKLLNCLGMCRDPFLAAGVGACPLKPPYNLEGPFRTWGFQV